MHAEIYLSLKYHNIFLNLILKNTFDTFIMTFCYSLICYGDNPLCQHGAESGNFDLYYQSKFANQKYSEGFTIFKVDNYDWGIYSDKRGILFICVVKKNTSQELLKRIISDIRTRFFRMFDYADWSNLPSFAFQSEFEPQLINVCSRTDLVQTTINSHTIDDNSKVPTKKRNVHEIEEMQVDEYTPLNRDFSSEPSILQNRRKWSMNKFVLFLFVVILTILITFYIIFAVKCGPLLNNCY